MDSHERRSPAGCNFVRVRWRASGREVPCSAGIFALPQRRRNCDGRPRALLQASATAPLADWIARLSDVAPDGEVTQITGAGINGAQRESMSDPKDLVPGKVYPLDIEMHLTSWVFPKGHRIRISISNALWPMILPTPYAMTTSLQLGGETGSRVLLPVVPVHGSRAPEFSPPQPMEERTDIKNEGFPWDGDMVQSCR